MRLNKLKNHPLLFVILIILTVGSYLFFIHPLISTSSIKVVNDTSLSDSGIVDYVYQDTAVIEPAEKQNVAFYSTIAQQMNSKTFLKSFHSTFASGIATPTTLTNYVTKTDYGYILNVKNATQVTSPTIYKNSLFVSGGFGSKSYYCFDITTQKLEWGADISDDCPSSSVIKDSVLIFNTESCTIFALNSKTGNQLWSKWMGDPMMSSPTLSGNNIYTVYPNSGMVFIDTAEKKVAKHKDASHVLACINIYSGKINWQRWLDGGVISAPVTCGNYLYLSTFTGTLYKFNKTTGELIAANDLKATSPPSINGNRIYISHRVDKNNAVCEAIAIMDATTLNLITDFNNKPAPYLDSKVQQGAKHYQKAEKMDAGNGFVGGAPFTANPAKALNNVGYTHVSALQSFIGSVVLYKNNKLYSCMGDELFCLDASTGKQVWSYKIEGDLKKEGGYLATSPLIVSNYIIIVTLKGKLLVFDINTGKEAFSSEIKTEVRNAPVVSKGWVYIPTTSGRIACVDTKISAIDGWGTFMGNFERNINN